MSSAALRDGILAVPVIDISSFRMPYADAAARAGVVRQVDQAARQVGFMQITGHGIAAATLGEFTAVTDAFFALDPAAKAGYRCPPGINRGYTPPKAESLSASLGLAAAGDLFEAMNVGSTAADFPGLGLPSDVYPANVFPSAEVPGFEAAVLAWFAAAGRVARTMVRIFGVALGGREDYFERFTDHSIDVLRMNSYRPADLAAGRAGEQGPAQLGMGPHTDYGIVTVLWADPVPGLEVHGADGRWHPVQPAGRALLVNLGDAIARWTNDEWISTLHRVTAARAGRRRSAAFFHDGNVDAVIECLPGCVSPARPARYQPVTVGEHLAAKLAGSRGGQLNRGASREAARLRSA